MKAYVVEKEALSHNIELLQKMANGVPIWAVLRATATASACCRWPAIWRRPGSTISA